MRARVFGTVDEQEMGCRPAITVPYFPGTILPRDLGSMLSPLVCIIQKILDNPGVLIPPSPMPGPVVTVPSLPVQGGCQRVGGHDEGRGQEAQSAARGQEDALRTWSDGGQEASAQPQSRQVSPGPLTALRKAVPWR